MWSIGVADQKARFAVFVVLKHFEAKIRHLFVISDILTVSATYLDAYISRSGDFCVDCGKQTTELITCACVWDENDFPFGAHSHVIIILWQLQLYHFCPISFLTQYRIISRLYK